MLVLWPIFTHYTKTHMKRNKKQLSVKMLIEVTGIWFENLSEIFAEYGILLQKEWMICKEHLEQLVQNLRYSSHENEGEIKEIESYFLPEKDLSLSFFPEKKEDTVFVLSLEALAERFDLSETLFRSRLQSRWIYRSVFSEELWAKLVWRYLYSSPFDKTNESPKRQEESSQYFWSWSWYGFSSDSMWSFSWIWGKALLCWLFVLSIPIITSLIWWVKHSSGSYAISDLWENPTHGVALNSISSSSSNKIDYEYFLKDAQEVNAQENIDNDFSKKISASKREHQIADDNWVIDFTLFLDESWEVQTHVIEDQPDPSIIESVKSFVSNLLTTHQEHDSAEELPRTWASL